MPQRGNRMSEPTIFVIEDEPSIAEVVSLYLRRAGFAVRIISDGLAALDVLASQIPDLVILDLMLPGADGQAITRWLRSRSDVPIIMLTARREEADRISGLEMGADDYVIKPFSPPELVSRVRAVLRRSSAKIPKETLPPLAIGSLNIDPQTRQVHKSGAEIALTAKEFDMLHWLARHPRQVFTRDKLLETIWGLSDTIDPSAVTVHIRRLREKIESDPAEPAHILTVWGVGYKFEP
jgi:two-component system, OmpR family, response regulator ResD